MVIKIDTDFNFNVLLKLCFSLSKKKNVSPILVNKNIPLKIYCENIVKIFHYSFLLLRVLTASLAQNATFFKKLRFGLSQMYKRPNFL